MNGLHRLGFGVAIAVLSTGALTACSSNGNSGGSSGSAGGSGSATGGSGSTGGSGTATSGAGTSGAAESGSASSGGTPGTASGTTSESGAAESGAAASGAAESGASSGASASGSSASGASSGAATDAGSDSSSSSEPDAATLTAECTSGPAYHGSATAYFPDTDFCALFLDTCSGYLISGAGQGTQSACVATYDGLTSAEKNCRSVHLCNATGAGAQNPHCYHAQGWGSATVQTGGPCSN